VDQGSQATIFPIYGCRHELLFADICIIPPPFPLSVKRTQWMRKKSLICAR